MAKVTFDSIFIRHTDGTLEPMRPIRIGGVQIGPGVRFGGGVSFSGIDISLYIGRDLQIEEENGITVLKGIY